MPPDPRYRLWNDDPPDYVFDAGVSDDLFSVEVAHNGFFCGLHENLEYVDGTVGVIDYCSSKTWSIKVVDEIVRLMDYERDERMHIYWSKPGDTLADGLVPIVTDLDTAKMVGYVRDQKTLSLLIDHTNFLRRLRDDVIINGGPSLPAVYLSPMKITSPAVPGQREASCSALVCVSEPNDIDFEQESIFDSESEGDSDFYDSDFNAEEGDDDLFRDNVDIDVDDNNEKVPIDEHEDDVVLEDDELNLPATEADKLKHKFRAFDPEIDMDNPVLKVGMVFSDVKEVRLALEAYSVRQRHGIIRLKNDNIRVEAVCPKASCPWMFKAGKDTRSGGFIVTAYEGKRTCKKNWQMRCLTSKFLAQKFMDEFRDNPKMDLSTFTAKVQREFNMFPDRWKLGRARRAPLQHIHGDEEAQFMQLWDYGQELRRANPGSKFFMSTNKVNQPEGGIKQHLSSLYWSYDACKRGFLEGCRPVIFIDGCHVKTRYKGQLLSAVGIDPNDCIFPIAMGYVEVECKSSWEWFLTNLRDDFNITNTSPWTIMSDRQKGLIIAVQKVWPDAEHRFCVRHLLQNFQKAGHRGETLKNDIWAIARSTSLPKWEKNMQKLKADSEAAFDWLESQVPNTWIKAFFNEFPKCDVLLNNHSEVFNSYILAAREMPFLSMLETIFYKMMQRIHAKQRECEKWTGRICPKIRKKLDKFTEWIPQCFVKPAGNELYSMGSHEVEQFYTVDLKAKTCDCKRWQLTGIPCHHVIACCREDNIDPESLVHSCYTIETYMKAYNYNLVPLRGKVYWEKMNGVDVHPPLFTKVMGRPKKNRKKAPEEKMKNGVKTLTKAGVTIHCSICGVADHNKKGRAKYVQSLEEQQQQGNVEEHQQQGNEEMDTPEILQNMIPHRQEPRLDPTHIRDSMVYSLGQEDRVQVPVDRYRGPLPESAFVTSARDSVPQARTRVTTASTRARGSTRGRGRAAVARQPRQQPTEPQQAATHSTRGRGQGRKRTAAEATTETANDEATGSTTVPYRTGPGSFYHLLFGSEQTATGQQQTEAIPNNGQQPIGAVLDLNATPDEMYML